MAGKGGKRPGAGRKPSTLKGVLKNLPKDTAELILSKINANQRWMELAASEDERIALDTMKYLTDRAYGRPSQAVQHTGEDNGPIQFVVTRAGAKES